MPKLNSIDKVNNARKNGYKIFVIERSEDGYENYVDIDLLSMDLDFYHDDELMIIKEIERFKFIDPNRKQKLLKRKLLDQKIESERLKAISKIKSKTLIKIY